MSRVASFELFERMFITKHYVAPVLLGVGLSEPQSTTLVGFRQSRGFTLSECMQVSTVHCSLLSRSSHRQPSVSSAPSRSLDSSGVFSPSFSSPQSAPHASKVSCFRPAPAASSSEPESLYLDIQRVTNRRSNPVLRQISAVVKPSLCRKTTAPRSSGGLRDMRFCRKKSKIQYLQRHRILNVVRVVWCRPFSFTKN